MRSINQFPAFMLLLFTVASVVSCKKTKETCCHDILSISPVTLTFIGYDSTDLKNLRMIAYKRDSIGITNPIDTVLGRDYEFSFTNGKATVVSDTNGKFKINSGIDYIISLSDSSSVHTITGQIAGEPQTVCFESEHCSPGSLQATITSIQNVHLDGNLVEPVSFPPVIFIRK
ncbi:MAG TPA: hypothetical protein VL093_01700 [Flavipsychrobacter sp.]|nr:hypothetical protein [Flavipsychrobacter sp.]